MKPDWEINLDNLKAAIKSGAVIPSPDSEAEIKFLSILNSIHQQPIAMPPVSPSCAGRLFEGSQI